MFIENKFVRQISHERQYVHILYINKKPSANIYFYCETVFFFSKKNLKYLSSFGRIFDTWNFGKRSKLLGMKILEFRQKSFFYVSYF